ncbi:receptor-type tyrosine-protein phosphatase T-like [Dermacentor andersoni]|uniref:receptor-type tyrosine-protein phosphatase T-like n=1 Tax=Dermacentor andersoni TaxID=34620 RepID=UPI0021553776|nr:receptor-type tyrosine-protein phosphatase T-like [Dermacentor andersoni]
MFSPGVVLILLGAYVTGARCTTIGCTETAEDFIRNTCGYEQVCTVHCLSSCLTRDDAHVYGTVFYSTRSSLCKSALHDLRISAWNTSALTASFTVYRKERQDFAASTRYGVTSESYFSNSEYFNFSSPRLKEDVLDITALHRNFIYDEKSMSALECHGPEGRAIYFDYAIKEIPFKNLTLRPEPQKGVYRLTFPKNSYAHSRTNVFWCQVESTTLSYVGSPAMYYDRPGPHFLPLNYTVTASLNEMVNLQVQPGPGDDQDARVSSWNRVNAVGNATDKLSSTRAASSSWQVQRAGLQHNGVYVASGMNTRSPGKNRAVFRVIVRTCSHGTYGPECNFVCPPCQNGGVCHDISGQCICPPGFRGQVCDATCGDDYFGQTCARRCSDTNRDKKDTTCRGILICLPDPYGCSCGTGYYGPFCNQTCPPHQYGADCKQRRICFCQTKEYCDIYTGTCLQDRGKCRQGWKNSPYCDQSYPLLTDGPAVSAVTDKEARVQFSAWRRGVDAGEGKPLEYRVQYKAENETWSIKTMKAVDKQTTYATVVKGLRSGTFYDLRVLVIDQDKNFREYGANVTRFRTACGEPKLPPQNVVIDNSSTSQIIVRWTNPTKESWQCWSVNAVLEVNGTPLEFNLTESSTTPGNVYSIPVTPYTAVAIRLRLRTPDNKNSSWTKIRRVTSAEDAPSVVPYVKLLRSGSRYVELSWGPPQEENGVLRNYRVVYTPLARRIQACKQLIQRDTEVMVPPRHHSVNLTGLRPYTKYRFSVAALTIKYGPEMNATFDTEQAIPEGAPTQVQHTRYTRSTDTLTWGDVPCEQRHGPIVSYYLEMDSVDPWETELRSLTVTRPSASFRDLVSYTRYRAKVYAENGAGRSPLFASLNFTTPSSPPPAPETLEYDQPSQDSVSLMWKAPYPPAGTLEHYQLKYWNVRNRHDITETVIAHTQCFTRNREPRHCFTVRELAPDVVYHFSVRAKNIGTEYSPYSEEVEVETREMAPEPPASIRSSEQTEDSLKIQWDPPVRKNGVLRGYKLNSSLSHTFNAMLAKSWYPKSVLLNSSDSPEFYLRGLFPGSTYLVCVQARTSAGFGNAICDNFSTKASTPEVQVEPRVGAIVNNTVSIMLYPVHFMKGPITGYYLVVLREGEAIPRPVKLVNYSTAQDMSLGYYVAAHLTPDQLKEAVDFVVGAGSVIGGFENPPLTDATPYRFGLLAESNFSGEVLYGYSLTAPVIVNGGSSAAGAGVVIGAILVLLILVIAAIALTFYYLRKRQAVAYRSKSPTKRSIKERLSRLSKLDENSMSESRMTLNMESSDSVNMAVMANGGLPSKPVPVKRLQEHVIQGQGNGTLKEEYMTTPKGQLHPWDVAKKAENKSKNRYGNILPYDHSRVKLAPLPDFENADYINASYVPGYRCARKYIATQGPKQTTLTDFWRMVWQEGCCKVIMLTNLKEQEKTKCEQYWPETSQKYGKFVVTLMKTDTQVDFVVREFEVSLENKPRTIVQFHFTTWPDHGVPLYPDALLPFLRRIWDFQPHDDHPIIVHCSGGIGRTGTLILVDSMLSQAEAEGEVNLVAHLHAMRQCRVNLVESLEQYIFAYMALVEILCSKNHKLSVKEFVTLYQKLKAKSSATGKSAIELEYEELNRICPLAAPDEYQSARNGKNAAKNRSSKLLACDSRRPFLSVTADGSKTDYINAVYVDGFKRRKAYLVTQLPLPETIDDFWEMLAGSGSVTLVTLGPLQDETTPQFWPSLKTTVKYGKTVVEQTDTQDFRGLLVRTFKVIHGSRPARIMKQFHSQSWNRNSTVPSSCDVVLEILQHVDRWQMQAEGRTVVVQCLDGCQESGLYCVSAAICDQLKLEQELDVFRSVRNVRSSRPELIVDSEQYAFCYDLALSFLDTFDTYSNFQ